MTDKELKGILDKEYAIERLHKPELKFRFKVRAAFVKNAIKKYLRSTSGIKLLDFGAAEGLTMLEMNNLLPESNFTGIEYSEELINQAPTLPENIKLIKGDVTNIDNKTIKNDYDVVSALALLEHLKEPLLAVKQAFNFLKPGGLFIASSPSPFWDNISTRLGLLRDEQHEVKINKRMMKQLVLAAGFEPLSFKRFMWSPISFLSYLKLNVSPSLSLFVDNLVCKIFVFNWLFVNQAIIAKKPINR